MPDEHDTLVLLVQQLQDAVNNIDGRLAEIDTRTIVLKDYDLTNHLNRIDQTLIRVQERLDKLEAIRIQERLDKLEAKKDA